MYSSVYHLPEDVKAFVDGHVGPGRDHVSYRQLVSDLENMGYSVSKSAIGRYGRYKVLRKASKLEADAAAYTVKELLDMVRAMTRLAALREAN